MKKHLSIILAAVAALLCVSTSCLKEERSDVSISYSVLMPEMSYAGSEDIITILAGIEADSKKISDAFDAAFAASRLEPLGSGYYVLRDQMNNKKAQSEAKSIGDKANASLSGFSPRWEMGATIKISSMFGDETVVTYTYPAK